MGSDTYSDTYSDTDAIGMTCESSLTKHIVRGDNPLLTDDGASEVV